MDDKQLSEIEARANAATPGPWGAGDDTFIGLGIENDGAGGFAYDVILAEITPDRERQDDPNTGRVKLGTVKADGAFIAHAREDVPALLAEVRRLRTKLDQPEASALDVVDERDRCERLLDRFAYTVAPVEVIGEHSSGNDPWENALDMLSSAAQVEELEADRDRARDAAVALEQENARLREELGQLRLDDEIEQRATALSPSDFEEPF
jgi:hypothetical protein